MSNEAKILSQAEAYDAMNYPGSNSGDLYLSHESLRSLATELAVALRAALQDEEKADFAVFSRETRVVVAEGIARAAGLLSGGGK